MRRTLVIVAAIGLLGNAWAETPANNSADACCPHGSANTAESAGAQPQGQSVTITVDGKYSPNKVEATEGKSLTLKFDRKDSGKCTDVVEIPAFKIKQELPTGKSTSVTFTPTKAGTYEFRCGMNMLKGQIIVKPAGAPKL